MIMNHIQIEVVRHGLHDHNFMLPQDRAIRFAASPYGKRTITLDFALARLASVIENLLIYPEAMQKNLDQLGGLVHSQQVLLALTQKGCSREDAYLYVQRNAMRVWQEGKSYLPLLKDDRDIASYLDGEELEALFNLDQHFRHIDTIFARVFPSA